MNLKSRDYLYGIHSVEAVLRRQADTIAVIRFITPIRNPRLQTLWALAEQSGITIRQSSRAELDSLSTGGRHQGVLAELKSDTQAHSETTYDLNTLLDKAGADPLVLILDGVQDPHNLGACLRTADAAGAHAVIAPSDRAVGLTASVRKTASGAVVPFVQVSNLARCLRDLKQRGLWVLGTAEDAESTLYQTDLNMPLAWVLGSEGKGLRRLTREHCDQIVNIPMGGTVSSLNVSVATGVVLFETVRQRANKRP